MNRTEMKRRDLKNCKITHQKVNFDKIEAFEIGFATRDLISLLRFILVFLLFMVIDRLDLRTKYLVMKINVSRSSVTAFHLNYI